METPENIVHTGMYDRDAFSKWLGIEILELDRAYCKAQMIVRLEMLNGFKIAHGGISYSFSDSIFAFASNSEGYQAVSIETSISHTKTIKEGDVLIGESRQLKAGKQFSIYEVIVKNQKEQIVSIFKGTVYKSGKLWEIE